MLSLCHTIAHTCGNLATSRGVGASGRKRLSSGVGWLGSKSHLNSSQSLSAIQQRRYQTPHSRGASRARDKFNARNPFPPSPASSISHCQFGQSRNWGPTSTRCTRDGHYALTGIESKPCIATSRVLLLHGSEMHREAKRAVFAVD